MSVHVKAGRIAIDVLDVLKNRCISNVAAEFGETGNKTSKTVSDILNKTFAEMSGVVVDTITGTVVEALEEGKRVGLEKPTKRRNSSSRK